MPQLVDNHPRALLLLLFSAVYYFITGETFVLTEFIGAVTAESAMNTNCLFWHFFFLLLNTSILIWISCYCAQVQAIVLSVISKEQGTTF